MQVVVGDDQAVRLEDAHNFKDFKVVAHTATPEMADVAVALRRASAGDVDETHGWISERWLRAQVGEADWQEGLGKMLSFAQSKGWMNEAGAIRAHVEWA